MQEAGLNTTYSVIALQGIFSSSICLGFDECVRVVANLAVCRRPKCQGHQESGERWMYGLLKEDCRGLTEDFQKVCQ